MAGTTLNYEFEQADSGEQEGHRTFNEHTDRADTWMARRLVSRGDNTPPGSPSDGDAYLLGASPTGAWAGQANQLADYLGGNWYFFAPFEGLVVRVADENLSIEYDGTNWTALDGYQTLSAAAASIAWDISNGASAVVTLGANGPYTLSNPTNGEAGRTYTIVVKQDGTGSRTLAFDTAFDWAGGTAPTITAAANSVDVFSFFYDGTTFYGTTWGQNFS